MWPGRGSAAYRFAGKPIRSAAVSTGRCGEKASGSGAGGNADAAPFCCAGDRLLGIQSNQNACESRRTDMRIFAIRAARYLGVLIGEVKIPGRDTDDILYEPTSKRVFTFNGGKGNDATAIDAVQAVVLGISRLAASPKPPKR